MATFAIGDVQGCFDQLMRLLDHIQFSDSDTLWFTGDLVNRGPDSLKTLRWIKSLQEQTHQSKRAIIVLGNHDLVMLAILRGKVPFNASKHTFSDIMEADDREELCVWLEQQPLLHEEIITHEGKTTHYVLVHAGIYPYWSLEQSKSFAEELETVLQSDEKYEFYAHLYGNTPTKWDPNLAGFDRLRFIVDCFTRMRFINNDGELELETKTKKNTKNGQLIPWFEIENPSLNNINILFGHWSALEGKCSNKNCFALDTGCVWGNSLTALRLEDLQVFKISCST